MSKIQLTLKRPWEIVKEQLKENDHRLTDEDLVYDPGNADKLLEQLSKKLNRTKEEIKELIESISANEGKAS
ncbi:MAG: general stress protein CsbD [Chitinophagaceae bacterium]|nr:general stress protein CsbD [Chitinophagaceae bacterium]